MAPHSSILFASYFAYPLFLVSLLQQQLLSIYLVPELSPLPLQSPYPLISMSLSLDSQSFKRLDLFFQIHDDLLVNLSFIESVLVLQIFNGSFHHPIMFSPQKTALWRSHYLGGSSPAIAFPLLICSVFLFFRGAFGVIPLAFRYFHCPP